ncbi:dynamin-like GTPase mgm1, partial [Ascosphaera aggregata]
MFGGVTIAGAAYVQYQAGQAGIYITDIVKGAGQTVGGFAKGMGEGLLDIAQTTRRGWNATKESFELPEWAQRILSSRYAPSYGKGNGDGPEGNGKPPRQSRIGPASALAGVGAVGMAYSDDDDDVVFDEGDDGRRTEQAAPEQNAIDGQMMLLTRKMIEIRTLLQKVGQSDTMTLPSIVVIGSQSSGKSFTLFFAVAVAAGELVP